MNILDSRSYLAGRPAYLKDPLGAATAAPTTRLRPASELRGPPRALARRADAGPPSRRSDPALRWRATSAIAQVRPEGAAPPTAFPGGDVTRAKGLSPASRAARPRRRYTSPSAV